MKGIATDPAKLASIRAALATTERYQDIAARHGVSIGVIQRVAAKLGVRRLKLAPGTQEHALDPPGAPVRWLDRPPPRIERAAGVSDGEGARDGGGVVMLVRNRPTPEGRALGAGLARLCDAAEAKQRPYWPGREGRCKSCAFRAGTVPNGCLSSVADGLKAALEHHPFMCHQHFNPDGSARDICQGWALLMSGGVAPIQAPWPWSDGESDV